MSPRRNGTPALHARSTMRIIQWLSIFCFLSCVSLQQATSGSQDITVSRVCIEVHECTSEARVVGGLPDNGQMVHRPTRSPEHRDRWRLGLSDSPPTSPIYELIEPLIVRRADK